MLAHYRVSLPLLSHASPPCPSESCAVLLQPAVKFLNICLKCAKGLLKCFEMNCNLVFDQDCSAVSVDGEALDLNAVNLDFAAELEMDDGIIIFFEKDKALVSTHCPSLLLY